MQMTEDSLTFLMYSLSEKPARTNYFLPLTIYRLPTTVYQPPITIYHLPTFPIWNVLAEIGLREKTRAGFLPDNGLVGGAQAPVDTTPNLTSHRLRGRTRRFGPVPTQAGNGRARRASGRPKFRRKLCMMLEQLSAFPDVPLFYCHASGYTGMTCDTKADKSLLISITRRTEN